MDGEAPIIDWTNKENYQNKAQAWMVMGLLYMLFVIFFAWGLAIYTAYEMSEEEITSPYTYPTYGTM